MFDTSIKLLSIVFRLFKLVTPCQALSLVFGNQ